MADCNADDEFEDNVMTVKYVPIMASATIDSEEIDRIQLLEDDDIHYYSRCKENQKDAVLTVKERVPPVVMCYMCKLKPKAGTLNLEACVEQGVPPGPLLGQLKNGQDVVLPNGTVVKSNDVTNPEQPGPAFLVVDCPSEEFVEEIVKKLHLLEAPHTVIHFTPSEIQNNAKYREWVEKFPTETNHIYLNAGNSCIGSVAVHRIQHMLNMIHPKIFPLLDCSVGNGIGTMTSLHLRPIQSFDSSTGLKVTPEEYINESFNTELFRQQLEIFQKDKIQCGEDYPQILFLGTGSCIPNKTRNTSGIMIHMTDQDSILLDCGEATFNQIIRFYGIERAKKILAKLRMIYVSHLHADHHIGLIGLLKGRARLLGSSASPVYLLAPQQIMNWLQFYHIRFENILSYFHLVPNWDLKAGSARNLSNFAKNMISNLNCTDLGTVLVRHCPNAFGIAISHRDGWKITYSGDTMPCDDLVSLGYGSDILIHEATMEDELEEEARLKFHSTTSQAIHVGRTMDAKFIMLTHFSQRYAKIPRLSDGVAENVGIAFDNMQVSLKQLPQLSKMLPVLQLLFADHCDEMDAKAMRRFARKQLKRSASPTNEKNAKITC